MAGGIGVPEIVAVLLCGLLCLTLVSAVTLAAVLFIRARRGRPHGDPVPEGCDGPNEPDAEEPPVAPGRDSAP